MTARVTDYVERFAAVNGDLIAAVAGCDADEWRRATAAEGWPLGMAAHHVGEVNGAFARMVAALAAGETFSPRTSMDEVHRGNARHAEEFAAMTQAEALDTLRAGGEAVTQALRGLSDDHLDHVAGTFGGRELTVAQVLEWIVIGHTAEHLASFRATLDGPE